MGLSSRLEDAGAPDVAKTIDALMRGETGNPPYTIEHMADDAAGLLDALGIGKAHICVISMGGMIAQSIAINHPQRVVGLISIYSKTGDPDEENLPERGPFPVST